MPMLEDAHYNANCVVFGNTDPYGGNRVIQLKLVKARYIITGPGIGTQPHADHIGG